jgi:hypothetical protein
VALLVAIAVLTVLVLAQLALPTLAERSLRGRLEDDAQVERVDVRAFPAVKLLWRHADRVEVELADLRAGSGRIADLVDEAQGVGEIDARVRRLRTGPLTLRGARLRKDGDLVEGDARVTDADVRAALPGNFMVRPVRVEGTDLVIDGSIRVLGRSFGLRARVAVRDGGIVIAPEGVPLVGGALAITVFRDPRVRVDSVGARVAPAGFDVTARGRLR